LSKHLRLVQSSILAREFRRAAEGKDPDVADSPRERSGTPALRYLAILSAARDFGVPLGDIERVARHFHPCQTSPRELADALADALTRATRA
jgi:hypothetical protein